eukprot:scaffold21618_cov57-Phaeocystis_antarctica.AAC.1
MNVHARPRWSLSRPGRPRCATTSDLRQNPRKWRPNIHQGDHTQLARLPPATISSAQRLPADLTSLHLHAAINPATARATFSWRWLYMLHGAAEADWTATVIDRKEAVPLPAEARLVLRPDASSEGLSSWKLRPFVRGGACPSQWLPVLLATSACRLRREPLCPSR